MIQTGNNSSIKQTSFSSSESFEIEVNDSTFQLLTSKMYNKPVRAVIREWSTNAVDACIAAGKTPEFTVNVPTVDNPVFSVRDYGTGLPLDKIKSLFFRLGASSKRDSNDFNGTLG